MRNLLLLVFAAFLLLAFDASAQNPEAMTIKKRDLAFKYLKTGNSSYIIFFKKTPEGPAEKITLVKINVEPTIFEGKKAFKISQQWESGDMIVHTSNTVHDASDFSTLHHETWWKARDFSASFDFMSRKVAVEGKVDDAAKAKIVTDFNDSFKAYNLCWHSDLTIFPLFPYKDGRTFRVNFYDPGAGSSTIAEYTVVGSQSLYGSAGENIDCWIMEYASEMPNGGRYVQRFWISKDSREVLKEEDKYPGGFRYKIKLRISGEK